MNILYTKRLRMKIILELDTKQGKIQSILLPDILGTGAEYIWQEVEKISDSSYTDILSKDTGEVITSIAENGHDTIVEVKYDWTPLYGELNERRILFCFFC